MAEIYQMRKSQMVGAGLAYVRYRARPLDGSIHQSDGPGGLKFYIYLPPDYEESADRYPVLLHLHGAKSPWKWVGKDINVVAAHHEESVRAGESQPMIIVAPHDAHGMTMWSDGSIDMARQVTRDLIPHIDQTWRTIATRDSRAIQGFSMGGFGAATLGMKYQELFSGIIVWDGALHDWETLTAGRPSIARDQFGGSEATFLPWSPWALAEETQLNVTPVMVVSGAMAGWADKYVDHLKRNGVEVSRLAANCGHDLFCMENQFGREAFRFIAKAQAGGRHM
ncbi:MAG: hypothetical protein GY788_16110 [bacterium]|nr:hypothetical protein [bacterium]